MEQYIHTLIAADSEFGPQPKQISEFFEILRGTFSFRIISDTRFQPGLRVIKPSDRVRSGTNPMTGETISIPTFDHVKIERISDLPKTTEGLKRYSVLASGEWRLENPPLALFTTDEVPLDGACVCEASCHVRSEPVSTSCWDYEAGPNIRNVPHFGEACQATGMAGIFSNPWTGEVIEVPHAGCARFWIEFEFGKFLLPKIGYNLDVFDAVMVAKIEECFGTRFVQGCRFN